MSMNLRPEAHELLERVSNFLESEVAPNEAKFHDCLLYTSPSPRDGW